MKQLIIILTLLATTSFACAGMADDSSRKRKAANENVAVDTVAQVVKMAEDGDAVAQNRLGYWYYVGYKTIRQDYKQAYDWWSKAAAQDNADALGNLGICYQMGRGVAADSLKAVECYENALRKGNKSLLATHDKTAREQKSIFSALLLREVYAKGIGTKHDNAKSGEYLRMAATYGNKESLFDYGLLLYNQKEFGESAKWLLMASKEGNMTATYLYGLQLFQGKGIGQDKEKGIQMIEKAAEAGKYMANYEMGRICLEGDGVEKDAAKAVEYLKKAAPRYKQAAWLLGNCYKDGVGVEQDYYFAAQWIGETIDDGKESRARIDKLIEDDNDGTFTQYLRGLRRYFIDKDYDKAIAYFNKVAKAKVVEGNTMKAMCLANPKYAKANPKKAAKLLEKAAKDSPAATYYLSTLYETGTGVEKDDARAVDLLQKASEEGVAYAQCKLADRYFSGNGVSKDLTRAAQLYLQAEASHRLTPSSAMNLARLYEMKVAALPDLDAAAERIKALKAQKDNVNLSLLLARVPMQ